MKFLKYLQEEYVKRIHNTEVFNFPDKKEIRGIKELRFIVEIPKRSFYVWDANSELLHDNVSKGKIIINGICAQRGGKFVFLSGEVKNNPDWDSYKIYSYGNKEDIKAIKNSNFFNKILRYFDDYSKDLFLKFIDDPVDQFT